ncbi:hypothetical protein NPN19_24430, partial [Vibrio parahaemolyticus]|nr:hypothetical protein [Vibrio parahaemolyticus]
LITRGGHFVLHGKVNPQLHHFQFAAPTGKRVGMELFMQNHLIKTLVWCDNEWGFANRMLDTTLAMAAVGFRLDASASTKL